MKSPPVIVVFSLLLVLEVSVAFLPSPRTATGSRLDQRLTRWRSPAAANDETNDEASSLPFQGEGGGGGGGAMDDMRDDEGAEGGRGDDTPTPLRQPEWTSPPTPTPFTARPSDRLKPPGLRDQVRPPPTTSSTSNMMGGQQGWQQQPARPPPTASDERNTRLGGGFKLEKQPSPARLREDQQRDQLLGFFGNSTAMLFGCIACFIGAAFFSYAIDNNLLVNTRDIMATQELYEQARQEARMKRPQIDPENVDVKVVFE